MYGKHAFLTYACVCAHGCPCVNMTEVCVCVCVTPAACMSFLNTCFSPCTVCVSVCASVMFSEVSRTQTAGIRPGDKGILCHRMGTALTDERETWLFLPLCVLLHIFTRALSSLHLLPSSFSSSLALPLYLSGTVGLPPPTSPPSL